MTSLSHVHSPSDIPLQDETLGQCFDRVTELHAGREAVVFLAQGVRWTYARLREEVDRVAAGLLRLGLRPGDRVGIWSPNRFEWILTQFATAKVGLIQVNINPAYRAAELAHALVSVGCRALVCAPRFKNSDYLGIVRELAPELAGSRPGQLCAARLPGLQMVIPLDDASGSVDTTGCIPFAELRQPCAAEELAAMQTVAAGCRPDDPINIQFTSGTTGLPKGATLSHFNILNNALIVGRQIRFGPDETLCLALPLYHCFGMVLGSLMVLANGARIVYPGESFDPGTALAAIGSEACTAFYGVPTMFIAALEHPDFDSTDLASLRTGIMGGAPCPEAVMRRVMTDMHIPEITIAFGMTETSPASFQTSADDSLARRVSTVGTLLPHAEARIADAEGHPLPRGTPGEVLVRGYLVMKGYWGDDAATATAIDADGWMHTGDIGVLDDTGYLSVVGRIKDVVIRGGENIFPREVEEFLFGHEAVEQVAVFGVPDERMGEELCAWIRLREGRVVSEAEIRAYCQERIARFKIPRYIRFVETFPMTVTGKIQKFVMRKEMAEALKPPASA
ncbi:MAG: AMP-binding protein [Proteobacteria bacterium]|nr:AMP-binding protein [Pseudomonadota bacterium]HQR03175.1 AMP-binding protein [Rhodocyclaceae bacterium]